MPKLLLLLALVGCQKDLVAELPDAPPVPPDASTGCPVPTSPLVAGHYQVYLNTEGPVLTMSACDDSRTNCTSEVAADQTVVPPFLPAVDGREAYIALVVSTANALLAAYSVDVVTTRPTSGDYEMIVLGGTPSIAGQAPQVQSLTPIDCSATNRNHIDLIFDLGECDGCSAGTTTGYNVYAHEIAQDLGTMVGLGATLEHGDCECRSFDPICNDTVTDLCTFGTNAPTMAAQDCGHAPTQDEPALLKAAFGCR